MTDTKLTILAVLDSAYDVAKVRATQSKRSSNTMRRSFRNYGSACGGFWNLESKTKMWAENGQCHIQKNSNCNKLSGRACKPDSVRHASVNPDLHRDLSEGSAMIIPLGPESLRGSSSLPEGRSNHSFE